MTTGFARVALNAALALAISLGLSAGFAQDAHAKKKKKKPPEETTATDVDTKTTTKKKTSRGLSSSDTGATFHCVGIGKGHHFKGMTEADCKKAGGTVTH